MKNLLRLLDIILTTLLVFAIVKFFPIFFSLDMFDPIQNTLEEMHITDMVFSKMRDYDAVEVDSNIVIINNGHLNRAEIEILSILLTTMNLR